jgi:glycosyltransferase involved in cell wall biosynthesis
MSDARITLPSPTKPRVLIATIEPGVGGVGTMAQLIVNMVKARGYEPIVAYYAPFRRYPTLSRPSFKWFTHRVGYIKQPAFGVEHCYGIGASLPELEYTHYAASESWRSLVDACDAHLSVSGNVLAATAMQQLGKPVLAWVATDWAGDRVDRVSKFSPLRKLFDRWFVEPRARRLERNLLLHSHVLALSEHTKRALDKVRNRDNVRAASALMIDMPRMPMPIDSKLFAPDVTPQVRGRIGFVGRFDDPRKNILLLIETVASLRARGHEVHGYLVGGESTAPIRAAIERLNLGDAIKIDQKREREELPGVLRTFDLFFLPSHQEGLCIAALEAMACGVPVVSTRCGGPEEFVVDERSGALVDATVADATQKIEQILADENRRKKLGGGARQIVENQYSQAFAEQVFWRAFDQTFTK